MPTKSAEDVLVDRVCNYYDSGGKGYRTIWGKGDKDERDRWFRNLIDGDLVTELITDTVTGHQHFDSQENSSEFRGRSPSSDLKKALQKATACDAGEAENTDLMYRALRSRMKRLIDRIALTHYREGYKKGWIDGGGDPSKLPADEDIELPSDSRAVDVLIEHESY